METFLTSPWLIVAPFALFWIICAGGNFFHYVSARNRGGSTSLTLFLGGIAGAIAVLLCPIPGLWIWFWVPGVFDIGSLPALCSIIYSLARKRDVRRPE